MSEDKKSSGEPFREMAQRIGSVLAALVGAFAVLGISQAEVGSILRNGVGEPAEVVTLVATALACFAISLFLNDWWLNRFLAVSIWLFAFACIPGVLLRVVPGETSHSSQHLAKIIFSATGGVASLMLLFGAMAASIGHSWSVLYRRAAKKAAAEPEPELTVPNALTETRKTTETSKTTETRKTTDNTITEHTTTEHTVTETKGRAGNEVAEESTFMRTLASTWSWQPVLIVAGGLLFVASVYGAMRLETRSQRQSDAQVDAALTASSAGDELQVAIHGDRLSSGHILDVLVDAYPRGGAFRSAPVGCSKAHGCVVIAEVRLDPNFDGGTSGDRKLQIPFDATEYGSVFISADPCALAAPTITTTSTTTTTTTPTACHVSTVAFTIPDTASPTTTPRPRPPLLVPTTLTATR